MNSIISISLLLLSLTTFGQSPYTYKELVSSKSRIDSIGTDTLAVIKELLKAKGDETLNKTYYGFTDSAVYWHYIASQSVRCASYDYQTNQVAAMYLMYQLYYGGNLNILDIKLYKLYEDKYWGYSNLGYQRYYKKGTMDCVSKTKPLNIKEFKQIFQLYIDWFEQVEQVGLVEARKMGLDPLKGTPYKWETDPTNIWWYVNYNERHKN